MNRLKILFTFSLIIVMVSFIKAQSDTIPKRNLVKINFLSLAVFKTTTLNYERSIGDKLSIGLGMGRKFSGSLPSLFRSEESDLRIPSTDVKGLFFNFEARWYLDRCNKAGDMRGFFIGPYLKMNRYSMDFDTEFDSGDETIYNSGEAKLVEFGIGGLIGYQLELWDKFTIDFVFFGPRISRFNLSFGFENEISDEFTGAVEDNVNAVLEKVLMDGGIDIDITDREIKTNFMKTAFKYGIGIGYKF